MGLVSDHVNKRFPPIIDYEEVLWTPAEITTALWLDAADASTVTVDSGVVSQRRDKSGNARHSASNTIYRPVAGTNKDVYDGSNDCMIVPSDAAMNAPVYIACACKPNITLSWQGLVEKWVSNTGWQIQFGSAGDLGKPALSSNGSFITAPANLSGLNVIIEGQISGASSFIGTPAGVTSGTLPAITANSQNLYIGGDGSSTNCLGMDFYELIILGSAPDTTMRQKIQGYIAHKWDGLIGVTTLVDALPHEHPCKSKPPVIEKPLNYFTTMNLEGR